MNFRTTPFAGLIEIDQPLFQDERGSFFKFFSKQAFSNQKLGDCAVYEVYFSRSKAGVLRGLHFLAPPHDSYKIVSCLEGRVLDVVVDLRKSSATFGQAHAVYLAEERGLSLFIPPGFAHGFYVTDGPAYMAYAVGSNHHASLDQGILWSSADVDWPNSSPILSARDQAFPRLQEFESPFK